MKKKIPPTPDLENAVAVFLDAESRIPKTDPPAWESSTPEELEAFPDPGLGKSEQALFTLFAALPHPGPAAADFADAILQRTGKLRRDLGWKGRFATAAAFFLVLAGAYWLWPVLFHLASGFEVAAAIAALVDVFTFFVAGLGDLMILAERLAGFGRIFWLILVSPPVILTLTLSAALTLLMGRWLAALLTVPRSSLHAAAP